MFVVLLKFSGDRSRASGLMEGHNAWIRRGFDDGVFLIVGSLQPQLGGGIVAPNTSRPELEERLAADPFVAEEIVTVEVLEVTPKTVDDRLNFLLD